MRFADGKTTTFSYDLTGTTYNATGAPDASKGSLSKIDDRSGSTSYQRDIFGRIVQKTQTLPNTSSQQVTTTFTATGQTGTVTYPSGNQLGYGYSSAGQVNTLTWNGTPLITNLQWTPLNQPGTWTWTFSGLGGTDIAGKRSYDTAGRVSTTELGSYGYDAAGRITSLAQQLYRPSDNNPANSGVSLGTQSWTVGYDPVGRITSFIDTTAASTTTGPGTATFSYDSNGNRNASTQSMQSGVAGTATSTTRSYAIDSGSNRLLGYTQTAVVSGSTSTSTVSYTYNAAGDITSQGSKTFSFNAESRLSSVATGPTVTSPTTYYTHNALGQRVFKTEPTTGTATTSTNGFAFVYDEDGNLLGEYGTGGASSTGTAEYIWLPTPNGPMPIATVINGTLFAVHSDNLNTPRRLSNTAAQAVWQWKYSAFGDEQPTIARNRFADTTANPNPGTTTVAPMTFNLRYPGQYADVESGLNYNYFRNYDAGDGRYMQSDPIGLNGGWNRFGYVEGNSLGGIDPQGLADNSSPWKLGWEWLSGQGPRSHDFTDGDPFTELLRKHRHVQNLIREICNGTRLETQGRYNYSVAGWDGVPLYFHDYSNLLTGGNTGNLAATYLGSYNLAYTVSGGKLKIVVKNTSSIASATHPPVIGYTNWWNKNIGVPLNAAFESGPLSKTVQTFVFHESLAGCSCK